MAKTSVTIRDAGDVKIVELKGKITIGSGDLQMREAIHTALSGGCKKILVSMKEVTTIDSSGDQRRPHGDAADHRVRRPHHGRGGSRELLGRCPSPAGRSSRSSPRRRVRAS
jgi:hypothetical protein